MVKGINCAVALVGVSMMVVGFAQVMYGTVTIVLCFRSSFLDCNLRLANIDEYGEYSSLRSPGLLEVISWISIASGMSMFVSSSLMILGFRFNSKRKLVLACTGFVLVLIPTGISMHLGLEMLGRIDIHMRTALLSGINTQYEGTLNSTYDFSKAFDLAQVMHACCGVDNYTDFKTSTTWIDKVSLEIPTTCCKLDQEKYEEKRKYVFTVSEDCASSPNTSNSNIEDTCYGSIKRQVVNVTYLLLVPHCVGALLLMVSIVLVCWLASRQTEDEVTSGEKTCDKKK